LVDLELKPNENCGDTGYCGKDDHEKLNPLIDFGTPHVIGFISADYADCIIGQPVEFLY
jgi:hypothetical protein